MSIDGNNFRAIMRRIASPVVVLTMAGSQEMRGMTASSFTSVSLVPPLVSVSIVTVSRSHELMLESDYFAINLLADDQGQLADHFAAPNLSGTEQFATVPHRLATGGVPLLDDTLGWMLCRKYSVCEGGDHSIFLGEVIELSPGRQGDPLLFYSRAYYRVGEVAT